MSIAQDQLIDCLKMHIDLLENQKSPQELLIIANRIKRDMDDFKESVCTQYDIKNTEKTYNIK